MPAKNNPLKILRASGRRQRYYSDLWTNNVLSIIGMQKLSWQNCSSLFARNEIAVNTSQMARFP